MGTMPEKWYYSIPNAKIDFKFGISTSENPMVPEITIARGKKTHYQSLSKNAFFQNWNFFEIPKITKYFQIASGPP